MRKTRFHVTTTVALVGALLILPRAVARAGSDSDSDSDEPRVLEVDCTNANPKKHDSIAKALETKADELIIEIDGICIEDLVIRRDSVTVRGKNGNADLDGIHSASPGAILGGAGGEEIAEAVVWVRGGVAIRLEHLFIGEGQANRSGVVAGDDSVVTISNCRVENNPGFGVVASGSSTLFIVESVVGSNSAFGVASVGGSYLSAIDSLLSGGLLGVYGGQISLSGGSLSGAVYSIANSGVGLDGVTHTNGVFNLIAGDSYFRAFGSTLEGLILVSDFSTLVVRNGSTVEGSLACQAGGDAYCPSPATDVTGTSDCSQCLKP